MGVVFGTGLGEPVIPFESEETRCDKHEPADDRSQRGVQLEGLSQGIPCKGACD